MLGVRLRVLCSTPLQALYAGCATRRCCPRGQGSVWGTASDAQLAELVNRGVKAGVGRCVRGLAVLLGPRAGCVRLLEPSCQLQAGRPCWLGAECLEAVLSSGLRA